MGGYKKLSHLIEYQENSSIIDNLIETVLDNINSIKKKLGNTKV